MRKQITDADVTEFMSEFARYLLEAGVTSSRFARIARLAFFKAASENSKFTNSRLNRSAVAAMTGLTRPQVREFAQAKKDNGRSRLDHIQRVIRGWSTDASFTTSSHMPRRLSTRGAGASFGHLVRQYGGDIPARSVLREMVRNGVVVIKGEYAHLNRGARQTRNQAKLDHLSQVLAQLLKKPSLPSKYILSLRSTVREITYPSSSSKGRVLIQRKSTDGLQTFLSDLQAAGIAASIETPPTGKQKNVVTRTRVMVLTEELGDENPRVRSSPIE